MPQLCLARMDSGDVPPVNHLGEPLRPLGYLETLLVSRIKVLQQVLSVYRANCPPDARPLAYKTHGVTVSGPSPGHLAALLPMKAELILLRNQTQSPQPPNPTHLRTPTLHAPSPRPSRSPSTARPPLTLLALPSRSSTLHSSVLQRRSPRRCRAKRNSYVRNRQPNWKRAAQ